MPVGEVGRAFGVKGLGGVGGGSEYRGEGSFVVISVFVVVVLVFAEGRGG